MRRTLICAALLAACGPGPVPPPPCRSIDAFAWFDPEMLPGEIVTDPPSVFVEGTDLVTLTLPRACRSEMRIRIDGLEATRFSPQASPDRVTVLAPAHPLETGQAVAQVEVRCVPDPPICDGAQRSAVMRGALTFDASLEPRPQVRDLAPWGKDAPVVSSVQVTFTRTMAPESLTTSTFFVEGLEGTTSLDADGRTARFTPAAPFVPGQIHRAIVLGGPAGVRTARTGALLRPTYAPEGEDIAPDRDAWTFSVCDGCE